MNADRLWISGTTVELRTWLLFMLSLDRNCMLIHLQVGEGKWYHFGIHSTACSCRKVWDKDSGTSRRS